MSIKTIICRIRLFFAKKTLSAYMDLQTGSAAEQKISRLLNGCPEIQAYYTALLNLDAAIKALPGRMPPARLKQRIDAAIIHRGAAPPVDHPVRRAFPWVSALSSAAAVAVTALILLQLHLRRERSASAGDMYASLDMYQNIELYKHMDMIEHLHEVMAVQDSAAPAGRSAQ